MEVLENDILSFLQKKKPLVDSLIEKNLPRSLNAKALEKICGKPSYAFDANSSSRAINEIAWELFERGGKRWRAALFFLVAEAVGGRKACEKAQELAVVPEIVHQGTLIVDDVEDDSETRRGKPCLHKIHGTDLAINAGNALYFIPLKIIEKNKRIFGDKKIAEAYAIYAQEMTALSYGQALDIYWHKGFGEPNEKQYLQMTALKTGALARMSVRLAVLFAGGSRRQEKVLAKYAEAIGVAFQLQDDILNLTSKDFQKLKGVAEDIHEGKRTLVVIRTLKILPRSEAVRLRQILDLHSRDEKVIAEAVSLIKKSGAVEYAEGVAKKIVSNAWRGADCVLKESEAKKTLEAFADFLVERKI